MSTTLSGNSGSVTSSSAVHSTCSSAVAAARASRDRCGASTSVAIAHLRQLAVAALALAHELGVLRPTRLPALEHLVPGDRPLFEQPALVRRVEAAWEREIEHELALGHVIVRRHLQAQLVAQRHGRAQPGLPELVVRAALE